jgi:hypothetical protein
MNYTVDIIDTTDATHTIAYEFAEKSSIVLNWNGGDTKDDQFIVGSSFEFTLEVNVANMVDAKFRHLFTGSESKYKVILYKTDEPEVIIWTGFLLPDAYSEPYTNGTFYPAFEATDGLGALKGKTLPAYLYTSENSVITYLAEILKLTNLQLPINFSAAIENLQVKRYDEIYLSGLNFIKSDGEFENAYTVLENILQSMLCVVYQADNVWYIEGLNKRHLKQVKYFNYDYQGIYLDETKKNRIVKEFKGIVTPMITLVPPYNTVTVNHERVQQALPKTIAKEDNEGWAVGAGVSAEIYPTDWFGINGYRPSATAPDYQVQLRTTQGINLGDNQRMALLRKIYVKQFDKFKVKVKLSSPFSAKVNDITSLENSIRIDLILNNETIYNTTREFEDKTIEIEFDIYIKEAGLLDLEIVQPYFEANTVDNTLVAFISIDDLELSVIGFKENLIIKDTINEDFSINKDIDLFFADDATGFSKGFRLEKLDEKNPDVYNEIVVPILYNFTQNGNFYSVVDLYGANLIADNLTDVFHPSSSENDNSIQDLIVTYNYQDGEQMVVQTPFLVNTESFTVRRFRIKDVLGDRKYWEQWSDSTYPIENNRYCNAVAKVFRRLFIVPHEKVNFTQDDAVKFNDLMLFNYDLPQNYFMTNVRWDIDAGQTDITMVKAVYQNQITEVGTANVPPIVDAGEDIILQMGDFGATLNATAFDPDGFIAFVEWEVISGEALFNFNDRNSLSIFVLINSDVVVFRITVTDSDGGQAQDTVTVFKEQENNFSLTQVLNFNSQAEVRKSFKVNIINELKPNFSLKIKGVALLYGYKNTFSAGALNYKVTSFLNIVKNGVVIVNKSFSTEAVSANETITFEFNYIAGDDIVINLIGVTFFNFNFNQVYEQSSLIAASFEINSVLFQQGFGNITGVPVSRTISLG